MLLSIISIITSTIFMILFLWYTKKTINNNWYNQFIGSYMFWYNRLPNKLIKYILLACYLIFWLSFLYLDGIGKQIAIIYPSILSALVGFFMIDKKEKFLSKLHSSVLQISVWTGVIFVLVRCIEFWWISILSLLIPFLPYLFNKFITKNKVDDINGEIITFDVIYIWLAIFTIMV